MKNSIFYILLFVFCQGNAFAQKNLDFEAWDINNIGIDEALNWVNICDASKYGAPQVLFKEVEEPAKGMASIKLTTKYWKHGAEYELDTLIGALIQQADYSKRPIAFEFSYKASPKKGDAILIGVQLSTVQDGELVVIGEGYFTSEEKQKEWKSLKVNINYFSNLEPSQITIMTLSSANATIADRTHGSPKIGSTLFVDDIKLITPDSEINLTLLNTVK